ncbi:cupredoxin domain-containing protein [Marinicellulosiphila megalodicopiae]|uniref:cupredoxin domain-containing protein n=1 Tax=Marinicellulosiphila megalodicopiae TaxID=2724896 RepID=UPI003BAFB8AB
MIYINIVGVILMGLIVWWFWLYKKQTTKVTDTIIKINVENGIYQPANITVNANTEYTMVFTRKDETPCAEILSIPKLEINEVLPLNVATSIKLPKLNAGSYPFHCQMKMYTGLIVVE